MTSCHGYYEFFDYSQFKVRKCPTNPEIQDMEYPKDSLMGVLVQNFPRFAQIVIKAKFDRRFSDPQGKFTVFVSDFWEKFSAVELEKLDVGKSKEIVASNTIVGRIRTMDLLTSQDSQLTAVDNMGWIHVWYDLRDNRLKKNNEIVANQIEAFNGIIHPVHAVAPPDANIPVSPEY